MLRQTFSILLISLLGIFAFASCANSPSVARDFPPPLPPAHSMEINFSDFAKEETDVQSGEVSVNNFARAEFTAGIIRAVVEANLPLPKALLKAAAHSNAKVNKEGQWEWNYSVFSDGKTYEVRLIAFPNSNNSVQWKFYLSSLQEGLKEHLALTGSSNVDSTQGSWTVFNLQNAGSQEEVLKLKWIIQSQEEVHLKLEIASDRFKRGGDRIDYTLNNTLKSMIYYDAGKDQTTEIQWNVDTNIGYVFASEYNEGVQACWDKNFSDTLCSEL